MRGLDLTAVGISEEQAYLDRYYRSSLVQDPVTPFHFAFALFRIAVIFERLAARARAGAGNHPRVLQSRLFCRWTCSLQQPFDAARQMGLVPRQHRGRRLLVGEIRNGVFEYERPWSKDASQHSDLCEIAAEGMAVQWIGIYRDGGGEIGEQRRGAEIAVGSRALAVTANARREHAPAAPASRRASPAKARRGSP